MAERKSHKSPSVQNHNFVMSSTLYLESICIWIAVLLYINKNEGRVIYIITFFKVKY